jgi:hypothetical protein
MSAYFAFVFVSLSVLVFMPSFVATEYTSRRPARRQHVLGMIGHFWVSRGLLRIEPAVLARASALTFSTLGRSIGTGAWAAAKWSTQYLA